MKQSAPSRIINVSSVVQRMGKLDLDNMRAEKYFRSHEIYFNSKLANVLFTRELARRLHGTGDFSWLCWVPSHWVFIGMKYQKLAKQGAMKNMSATSCTKLLLSHHEIYSILEKAMYYIDVDKNKPAIFSCPRYFARVIRSTYWLVSSSVDLM